MILKSCYHTAKQGPRARGGWTYGSHVYPRHCGGKIEATSAGIFRRSDDQQDGSAKRYRDYRFNGPGTGSGRCSITSPKLEHQPDRPKCWDSRRRMDVVYSVWTVPGSACRFNGNRSKQLGKSTRYHIRTGGRNCIGHARRGKSGGLSDINAPTPIWAWAGAGRCNGRYRQAGLDHDEAVVAWA